MKRLNILVGIIGSGKSTLCKQEAEKGSIIINDDAIVNMLHGGLYKLYDEKLKCLYKSIETSIFLLAAQSDREIVIDKALNLTKMSRMRWISLAKSLEIPVRIIQFPILLAETHAKRRYNSDSRGYSLEYWTKVANHQMNSFQSISAEEIMYCEYIKSQDYLNDSHHGHNDF